VCVRPVTPAAWSRPPPILSITSCRRFPCADGCSRCRNASGPSCTTTPAIAGAVLHIFVRAICTTLRQASPGAGPGAHIGAISFLHRFGSSLNAHFHFHVCVIDGVFSEDREGSVQFYEATHLTASDWDQLQQTVRHRVLRYFDRHGLLERHVTDELGQPASSHSAQKHYLGSARAARPTSIRKRRPPPSPGGGRLVVRGGVSR